MGIILIAFIILGTFLMVFVNQFWDTRNLKKAKEDLNSYVLLLQMQQVRFTKLQGRTKTSKKAIKCLFM